MVRARRSLKRIGTRRSPGCLIFLETGKGTASSLPIIGYSFAMFANRRSLVCLSPSALKMTAQSEQVRQLISRSQSIRCESLMVELSRAITYCRIAKLQGTVAKRLRYLLVAEAASAKFLKLRSQGKIIESKTFLKLMALLEAELGGRLY